MEKIKLLLKHIAIISPQLIFIYLSYSYYYGYLNYIYPNRAALGIGTNSAVQTYAYMNIALSLIAVAWYLMSKRNKKKVNVLVLPVLTSFQALLLFLLSSHYGELITLFVLSQR